MTKRGQNVKYKKAPQAPRRFKSAYMFFSTEKHKEIREGQGEKIQTTAVAKMVSQAWKNLSADERQKWDDMASRDKARYEVEKTMYTGPWKIPAKKRTQKDPNAPKRPMSAFLSFSNSKRAIVKARHKDIGNAEVSRILAKMWKEAPDDERKEHIEQEYRLRQEYKTAIAEWRKVSEDELQSVRKKREDIALKALDAGDGHIEAAVEAAGHHHQQDHHHHPRQLHEECPPTAPGYPTQQQQLPGMPPGMRGRPLYPPPYPTGSMYPPSAVPPLGTHPAYPQHYDGYGHPPPPPMPPSSASAYEDYSTEAMYTQYPPGGGQPPPSSHGPPPDGYYNSAQQPSYQEGYSSPYPQPHSPSGYGGPPPGYEQSAYDSGYYHGYYPPQHSPDPSWSNGGYQPPYAGHRVPPAAAAAGGEGPGGPPPGHLYGGY